MYTFIFIYIYIVCMFVTKCITKLIFAVVVVLDGTSAKMSNLWLWLWSWPRKMRSKCGGHKISIDHVLDFSKHRIKTSNVLRFVPKWFEVMSPASWFDLLTLKFGKCNNCKISSFGKFTKYSGVVTYLVFVTDETPTVAFVVGQISFEMRGKLNAKQ